MRGGALRPLTEEEVRRVRVTDKILSHDDSGPRMLVVWSPTDLECIKDLLHDLDEPTP